MLDEPMTRDEAARYLGMKAQTLAAWAWRGTGPVFYKLGRAVRYSRADLDAWLASRRVTPGHKEGSDDATDGN